jgi:O-antigen/teichoic acid export membrane protein
VAVASGSVSRLLTGIVVARLLGPDLNGRYVFLLWLVESLVLVFNAGLPSALNRFLAHQLGRADAGAVQRMVRLGLWGGLVLSAGVALATFGLAHWYALAEYANPSLAAFLALLAAAQMWMGLAQSTLMGLHQFRAYAGAVVVAAIVLVIGQAIGVAGWGLDGAIYGALVSYAVGALLLIRAVVRAVPLNVSAPVATSQLDPTFLPYARDAWLAALISAVVWGRSELFFLERLSSPQEAGYFAAGLLFASLVVQSVNLISGALLPHLSRLVGAGDTTRLRSDYQRMTVFIALWAFPTSLLGMALMPQLIQVVFGTAYTEAAPAAQWLMATGLLTFATVGSAMVYGQGDAHIIRNWSLLGAVLLVALCTWLAPAYGAVGVAIGRLLVQATMIAISFYLLRTRYDLPVPFRPLLQILLAACASGLAAGMATNLATVGGVMAIAMGIAGGSLIYLIALRVLRAISAADAAVLRALLCRLPSFLATPANTLLSIAVSR